MKRLFLSTQPPYTLPPRCRRGMDISARIALTLLAMFMPLAIVWTLTYYNGSDLFRAVPVWTDDEPWWYLQYGAVSRFGRPLGYFGYAGTHARSGTFGPWGMYPALLTGNLARVFGWSLHSFVYYHFAYLAAATLGFILLTRPSVKGHIMLVVSNSLMLVAFCYTIVSMNEIVRYSVAILLTGIMYRLMVQPQVPRWRLALRWVLIPPLLLYATCFYLVLAIFIPVYLWLMLRPLRPVWRLAAGVPVTLYAVKRLRGLNAATCARYIVSTVPSNSSATFSIPNETIQRMIDYGNFVGKLRNIDPLSIMTSLDSNLDRFLLWFCLLGYITAGVLLWRCVVRWKDRKQSPAFQLHLLCLYLLVSCCGGLVLEYDTSAWTFIRNCNTAVCCVMLLTALAPKGDRHPWWTMTALCLAGTITFLSVFSGTFARSERFATDEQERQWAQRRAALAEVIVLDEDAQDPWSNTVVPYHADVSIFYCLPYGVGVNGAVSDGINKDARYVILGQTEGADVMAQDKAVLEAGGHVLIYQDDQYAVYENRARTYS